MLPLFLPLGMPFSELIQGIPSLVVTWVLFPLLFPPGFPLYMEAASIYAGSWWAVCFSAATAGPWQRPCQWVGPSLP